MGVRRKGLEEGGERVDEGDELAKDAWRRVACLAGGWMMGGGLVEVGLRWVEDGWRMGGRLVQKEKA